MLGNWKFSLVLVALVFSAQVSGQDDKKTTTTTAGTTTSTSTTTTTSTTTSTTPPPTTTTEAPTTTTSRPLTTTGAPTPAPKKFPANEGKWSVGNNNVTCILFKGALEFVVAYEDTEHKNRSANVDVPISANASGTCDTAGKVQTLVLTWPATAISSNTITLTFESNATATEVLQAGTGITSGKYALQDISGSLVKDPAVFINASNPVSPIIFEFLNKAAFQTPLNHSYSCLAQESLKSDDGSVTLKFSDVRMEAFSVGAAGHQEFSASIDCPADDASDLVPIAVGAALASLVVIVLIAYLIGRRRSRARGYQSV